ncbi:armadillo-type protein [Cryomyces antarcticus]
MADQEEDFSALPLTDRFAHKNWKVRKDGYEAAAKAFDAAPDESDPTVRTFIQDSDVWKSAVADSNVAAQQEALVALCSFLNIAGKQGCTRTRSSTITSIVEKGLTGRPVAKQKALEALLLYIELDKPDPVIEELLSILSHKQPKIIAATLSALTSIYHAYGCRTIEPKPVIKILPKMYGHADKNVRAEAQSLTVELYRWLKEAMKPLFWNDLKDVQQKDLEKLFAPVKEEPAPKQERLLRSQQAVEEASVGASGGGGEDEVAPEEEEAEVDLEPEFTAVDVFAKIPNDFHDRLASSKWKDRKEALDDLHTAINHPAIQEGPFNETIAGLAKSMKDANIAVVTVAANCVELLAKGLRRSFAKYRGTIMSPMMERLKEKKQTVTDALAAALDAVFVSTSLADCLEDVLEFLKHKNPQVKLESTRFLIRSLKATHEAPQPPEVKSMAEVAVKLLAESQETQRSAGAEVLGVLWKIMGDRNMLAHLEGLDEIRKTKIKEFYEAAEVKAKWKPKAAPPPPKANIAPTQRKTLSKKPALGTKRPAPAAARAPSPPSASKLGAPKSGLAPPSGSARLTQKKPGLSMSGSSTLSSPRRPAQPTSDDSALPPPKLSVGAPGRGLAGRPLGKPAPTPSVSPPPASYPASASSHLSTLERAELEDLRAEVERLRRGNTDLHSQTQRFSSQIAELQNQNAQFIEDHTRDVLSIKAKETQLVRARSDAENAEERGRMLERECERLKREVVRLGRARYEDADAGANHNHPPLDFGPPSAALYGDGKPEWEPNGANARFDNRSGNNSDNHTTYNAESNDGPTPAANGNGGRTQSPVRSAHRPHPQLSTAASHSQLASGRASPSTRSHEGGELDRSYGSRDSQSSGVRDGGAVGGNGASRLGGDRPVSAPRQASDGVESWRRAAEVTQNLKARIEMMKAKQGLARGH